MDEILKSSSEEKTIEKVEYENEVTKAIQLAENAYDEAFQDSLKSQIESEGMKQVEKLRASNAVEDNKIFGDTIKKIMANGCDKLSKETGRTGITYAELRQLYG